MKLASASLALGLVAGASLAQDPFPVATPAVVPAPATADVRPGRVISDLLQGNPAGPFTVAHVETMPHVFAQDNTLSFEWSTGPFALAAWDGWIAAFDQAPDGSATDAGRFVFGKATPELGLLIRGSFQKEETEDIPGTNTDTKYANDAFGVVMSSKVGAMDASVNFDWITGPGNTVNITPPEGESTTHSENIYQFGVNILQPTGSNSTLAAGVGYAYGIINPSGEDNTETEHRINVYAHHGASASAAGATAYLGLRGELGYHTAAANPDDAFRVAAIPSLAVLAPVWGRWTLLGGASLMIEHTNVDNAAGPDSQFDRSLFSLAPQGSFGVRYTRANWGFDAQVTNGFVDRGPYFISGAGGNLLARGAFTVSL